MHLTIHVPRPYEAEVKPALKQDLEIRPRFYRKQGWVPLLPITVSDAKGRERRYMLSVSATNGAVVTQEMKEVIPDADTKGKIVDNDNEEDKYSEDVANPAHADESGKSPEIEAVLAAAEHGQTS
jgi:hypothetical protein